jgi:hypothetical protein
MKMKIFCTAKKIVSVLKRWSTEWGCRSNKGLIARNYRKVKKLNSKKKINDLMKKWANELNRIFSTKEVQMTKNKP